MTSYFEMSKYETVESLKLKSMNHLLGCFSSILDTISKSHELPISNENWTRRPFTRRELNELCFVSPDNENQDDIERRINSTYYPSAPHGAFTTINGNRFYFDYNDNNRKPIV